MLALSSVGVGLGVLHELMACEMDQLVGPKGRPDPERTRHFADRDLLTELVFARCRRGLDA